MLVVVGAADCPMLDGAGGGFSIAGVRGRYGRAVDGLRGVGAEDVPL